MPGITQDDLWKLYDLHNGKFIGLKREAYFNIQSEKFEWFLDELQYLRLACEYYQDNLDFEIVKTGQELDYKVKTGFKEIKNDYIEDRSVNQYEKLCGRAKDYIEAWIYEMIKLYEEDD